MTARGGDFERPLGDLLPLDLGEVRPRIERLGLGGGRRGKQGRAAQVGKQGQQVGGGNHLELARPARLGALCRRADQPLVVRRRMKRGEQHSRRSGDSPVETQLADGNVMRQALGIGGSNRRQQAERDRQVIVRAFLRQVGGREVDGDDLRRQREADRGERGANALAAFGHGLVGQPDDGELRQARRQLDLHLDGAGFESEVGNGGDGRGHQAPFPEHTAAVRRPPSSAAPC